MLRHTVAVLALSAFTVKSYAASFTPLGDLAGGSFNSNAWAISADGAVVVGHGRGASDTPEAFRWTSGGGMVSLGDLPGGPVANISSAYGVSDSGDVVAGNGRSASGIEAMRWTSAGGMVGLGDLPGGIFQSSANDISADGSVVVGYGYPTATSTEAFRWTSAGGMVGLGDLAGGTTFSGADAISGDGSVIVGFGVSASGQEAFRWTSGGGMVGLGDIAGGSFGSQAWDVSADGTVVVGWGDAGTTAFVWTSSGGMQRLFDFLFANGATGLGGWSLRSAQGISADGQWVVGYGINPSGQTEAFRASLAAGVPQVPLPAAAWLFGGALGLLGVVRRRSPA